jgi:hypothetical protein
MTVDLPQINCPARSASRAEHVKPWRPCDQRGPYPRRPQHVTTGEKLLIPALDDGLRLGARGSIGNLPLGVDGNVQPPPRVRTSIGHYRRNRAEPPPPLPVTLPSWQEQPAPETVIGAQCG